MSQTRARDSVTANWFIAASALALAAVGCGGGSSEPGLERCVTLPEMCTPSFNTDYDTVYKNLLGARCGTASGVPNCHGSDGNAGGLTLANADAAHAALIADGLVIPGDAACSPLMVRLATDNADKRMPRGEGKLPDGIRCAVQRWIEAGAVR
jgi:hypothetical protein